MSTNKEIQSPDLSCASKKNDIKEPTNKVHQLVTMSLSSKALPIKMSTTEEFQSSGLRYEDCEYNKVPIKKSIYEEHQLITLSLNSKALPLKILTAEVFRSSGLSREDCRSKNPPLKKPTNEEHQLETLSSSSKALPSQVSSAEELPLVSMCLSSKALPRKMATKMIQSPGLSCQGCQCKEFPTNELSFGCQSRSCESCIARGGLATKIFTDEEIQSRSSFFEAIFTNKDSIESSVNLFYENHASYRTDNRTISPNSQIRAMGPLSPLDPSSYSRPELAIIKHISLILNVDFETHVLSGQAKIDFDVLQDINNLVLDASALIQSVEAEDGTKLQFEMGDHLANMGSKLTISLPKQFSAGEKYTVKIKYSTDPQASALQWLDPEQTSGKKHPYMFSQCQPIHARSILPCQDTPAVKFTYDAELSAPEEFTVLMSALRGEVKSNKTTFNQPMPLPSYLVAIAVGVLESRTLGPRSKVWSEKEEIERSAWEFAETEKYLQAAEKLCGPYEWTQYDLLVLPPSFPYGGMENPCLTFVTPTLLAGDRSQADVIVHEIMHSWTGNLVTNRNFEHFWLNEGFTVFLERKVGASLINDSVEAKQSRDFHSLLGLQELNEAIEVFGSSSPLTNLVIDLDGIHPDDAFSRVPYEKGSLFLRYLEDQVGGPEVFDDFLRAYLTNFRKKSLDTAQFQRFLINYFKDNAALKQVDWDRWLYKSGMPPIIPAYDTTMTKAISDLIVKINDPTATISHEDVTTFSPHQMIHLLQRLIDQPALPLDRLTTLGDEYKVNGNTNSEIHYRWLRLCIRSRDQTKISEVFSFVNGQGRMKYVRPLYRDLYAWEDVREQAIENFLKNEKYMMHVSAYTLRKDLHLAEVNAE